MLWRQKEQREKTCKFTNCDLGKGMKTKMEEREMGKENDRRIVKLKEIVEIIMGQSPKSEFYNTNREGLPFFQGCSEFRELYPVPKKWCTKLLKIAYKMMC